MERGNERNIVLERKRKGIENWRIREMGRKF